MIGLIVLALMGAYVLYKNANTCYFCHQEFGERSLRYEWLNSEGTKSLACSNCNRKMVNYNRIKEVEDYMRKHDDSEATRRLAQVRANQVDDSQIHIDHINKENDAIETTLGVISGAVIGYKVVNAMTGSENSSAIEEMPFESSDDDCFDTDSDEDYFDTDSFEENGW